MPVGSQKRSQDSPEKVEAKTDKEATWLTRAERNLDLCRARARGRPWHKIAEEFDVSERQARKIWFAWRETRQTNLRGRDPLEIVWEAAERYEAWIEQAAELALTTEHDSTRLGAIKVQARLEEQLTSLLQEVGILPKNLGRLRIDWDVRWMIEQIVTVFKEEKVPVDAQARIKALLETHQGAN